MIGRKVWLLDRQTLMSSQKKNSTEKPIFFVKISQPCTVLTFYRKRYTRKIGRWSFPDPGQPSNHNRRENASSGVLVILTGTWKPFHSHRTYTRFLCERFVHDHPIVRDFQKVTGIFSLDKRPKKILVKSKWGWKVETQKQVIEFFCHSDFTWNQSWQMQSLKICHFYALGGSEVCFLFFCNFALFEDWNWQNQQNSNAQKWQKHQI